MRDKRRTNPDIDDHLVEYMYLLDTIYFMATCFTNNKKNIMKESIELQLEALSSRLKM